PPAASTALALASTPDPPQAPAGRSGHHALPVDPGLDHQGAMGLATRDHPVGEPSVDGVPALPYRDRDVAGPDHGHAGGAGGQAAYPGIDRAVGVDDAHPLSADHVSQRADGAEIPRAAHANAGDLEAGGPRAIREAPIGLA